MIKQKIYIAGKITGLPKEEYEKAFDEAEALIIAMGHVPINPLKHVPQNVIYDDQMHICFALIDISDAVMMLDNWVDSPGATKELVHGATQEKRILYYDEQKQIYKGRMDLRDKLSSKHDDASDSLAYALNGAKDGVFFIGTGSMNDQEFAEAMDFARNAISISASNTAARINEINESIRNTAPFLFKNL